MPGEYPPEYRGGGLANYFRKQQGIDGIAKNVPQNDSGAMLSDNLSAIRRWLDNVSISGKIPYTDIGGKMGLGEMFMAQAPELVEDASWGIPPYKRTGHGYKLDPRMADVLGLPLPYAGGTQIAKVIGKKGLNKLHSKYGPLKSDLAPEDMSRRKFNKNALGTALGTGAVVAGGLAGKTAVKGIMDLAPKPHPYYSEAVVADLARPAAMAATRATVTNPSNLKMAQLILGSSNPKKMMENLKYAQSGEYEDILIKSFKDIDGKDIAFPDIDDVNWMETNKIYDFDMDEVKQIVDNGKGGALDRQWANVDEFNLDHYEVWQMIEDGSNFKNNKHGYNYDSMFSNFQDNGVDPLDVIDYIRKNEGDVEKRLTNIPDDLKSLFKKIEADPEEYYTHLDELAHNDSFNRRIYTDPKLNNPNDDFYFEPGFLP